MKRLTIFLVSMLLSLAQLSGKPKSDTYLGLEDNLSNLFIAAMDEEPSGVMWFATEHGINKYDGVEVTPMFAYNSGMCSSEINDIHVDRVDSHVWIASKGSGLNRYNTTNKEFELFVANRENTRSISGNSIVKIVQSPTDEMWFASYSNGINRYDRERGDFEKYNKYNIDGFPTEAVRTFEIDGDGVVYIGHARAGLTIFNPLTETIERFYHNAYDIESLPSNNILSIYCDTKGRIWIGTSEGLALFNPKSRKFIRYKLKSKRGDNIAVYDIKQRKDGEILIATEFNGVFSLNLSSREFIQPKEFHNWKNKTIEYSTKIDSTIYGLEVMVMESVLSRQLQAYLVV